MPKWLLPTLSEVLTLSDPTGRSGCTGDSSAADLADSQRFPPGRIALRQIRAEREWTGAIAALQLLLQPYLNQPGNAPPASNSSGATYGLALSGPLPVLSQPVLVEHLSTWTLAAISMHSPQWMPFQLLPADLTARPPQRTAPVLPLLPGDPLASEPFCLVFTPWFSVVMVLGETLTEEPAFLFSFNPEVVQRAWETIRPRILLMSSQQVDYLDDLIQQFPPVVPDYQTVMQFSRLLLDQLPDPLDETRMDVSTVPAKRATSAVHSAIAVHPVMSETGSDVELLQAIAHEVRTPLTTIRTLTRSLLKRTDLAPDVLKRLGIIDRECSEQIDRFGLIFRAVELETSATHSAVMALTRTSVADVFQQNIPRWQHKAHQRQMQLDFVLPPNMPAVVSDPTMLDQALTGLIERFTRNLPGGSHIQVDVTLAGDQLKLQLQSRPDASCNGSGKPHAAFTRTAKSIGQLLTFQPETGNLSLNLSVTKNLFQAIGGKLTVKHHPKQGDVMTVYLPLEAALPSPLDGTKVITI